MWPTAISSVFTVGSIIVGHSTRWPVPCMMWHRYRSLGFNQHLNECVCMVPDRAWSRWRSSNVARALIHACGDDGVWARETKRSRPAVQALVAALVAYSGIIPIRRLLVRTRRPRGIYVADRGATVTVVAAYVT